ncbi:MAG: trigger factor [Proteobacteria bacterium]|nr:trigger factor [Pseudomonadota bacterium]
MDFVIEVESKSEVARNLNIKVPRSEYQKQYDRALQKAAGSVQMKGFRKGHVPKDMLTKLYGTALHQEVMEDLALKALEKAVTEHKFNIVGRPTINFDTDSKDEKADINITAELTIFPEPKITGYDKLAIEVEVSKPKEDEYLELLNKLKDLQAKYEPVADREVAKENDTVLLDILLKGNEHRKEQKLDGRRVDIGKALWPEEFEKAILGMKIGEEKDITIKHKHENEEDAHDHDDHSDLEYNVKLIAIENKILPENTDEFAKTTGFAETFPELEVYLRNRVESEHTNSNRREKEDKILKLLIENNKFELPQALIDEEIRQTLFQVGVLDPRNQKSFQISVEAFRERLGEQAEYKARSAIILDRILKQDNFEPSDADISSWIDSSVEKWGYKNREDLEKDLGYPHNMGQIKTMMGRETLLSKLIDSAKVKEIEKKNKDDKKKK